MRLLRSSPRGTFDLTEYINDIPRYAILSHTWGRDEDEVSFNDVRNGRARDKTAGYAKLQFCAKQAEKDGIDYFWIDTCCINKDSDAELSEAIRSMFRWYQNAEKCYVFLSDVSSLKRQMDDGTDGAWMKSFRSSKWFTRGWTLQELLAPRSVEFYSREGVLLGCKVTLLQQIHEVTGIPTTALSGTPVMFFSIEERFTWAEKRQTKRSEDLAYCLFGIFDVQLPVLYGEGQESAMRRLKGDIGVTLAQVDRVIWNRYNNGRLKVERLSGRPLPLENCFVNLAIIRHVFDNKSRSVGDASDSDEGRRKSSHFSLAARLRVETPPQSRRLSVDTLFEPQKQKDGTLLRPKRILIWGQAGMGKTTLCKKIVYDFCHNGLWKDLYDRIIWLPLRRLKMTANRSVVELLCNEFQFAGFGPRVLETLNKLVIDERTLYLLDGLDEVSFVLGSDDPASSILHDLLSRAHVIITSRLHSTNVLDFKSLDLELESIGFFPQQVEEYVQRVAAEVGMTDHTLKTLKSFIQDHPLIQSLARIPIQLDAICYTWNLKNYMRTNITITSLYRKISEKLWKDNIVRLGKQHNGMPITKQHLETVPSFEEYVQIEISFLQQLAFRGLCEEIVEFDNDYIETLIISRGMFADVPIHLSFLRASDSSLDIENRTLHFIHLTFQEYFAAQHFASLWISRTKLELYGKPISGAVTELSPNLITPEEFLRSAKYDDRYDIFWRFVIGFLTRGNSTDLHRFLDILEGEPVDLVGLTHQRMIAHFLGELDAGNSQLRHRINELEDRYVQTVLYQSRLQTEWKWLTWLSPLISDAEGLESVSKRLLMHSETQTRMLQQMCRRSSVSSEVLDLVIQQLRENPNEEVRNLALKYIGQSCTHDPENKIARVIADLQCIGITSMKVLDIWGEISNLELPAVEILITFLEDTDVNICLKAASALSRQTTLLGKMADVLLGRIQTLKTGSDIQRRILYTLCDRSPLPDSVVNLLAELLQCSTADELTHNDVFSIFYKQTTIPSTSVDILVKLLQDPKTDTLVQFHAAKFLEQQKTLSDVTVNILARLLGDPSTDDTIQSCAANILKIHTTLPSTAVDVLIGLLHDTSIEIYSSALQILGRQASLPDTATDVLFKLWQDRRTVYGLLHCTATALSKLTTIPETIIDALVSQLRDTNADSKVRCYAVLILQSQTVVMSKAVDSLIELLQDRSIPAELSSYVKSALDQQALPEATIDLFMRMLQDSGTNDIVWSRLSEVLEKYTIFNSRVVIMLVRLLQDTSARVRCRAVRLLAIQNISSSDVVDALIRALQDTDEMVMLHAMHALHRQRTLPSSAVDTLVSMLQSRNMNKKFQARIKSLLVNQTSFSNSAVFAVIGLLQDDKSDAWHPNSLKKCLCSQASLPSPVVDTLIGWLYDTDEDLSLAAADIIEKQITLPYTAVNKLIELLQNAEATLHEYKTKWMINMIVRRREIQARLPSFSVRMLRHFIIIWFHNNLTTCTIDGNCFRINSSGDLQEIQLQHQEMESFKAKWDEARRSLGLPSFLPNSNIFMSDLST